MYQITGAVGLALKLIGKIPAKPLLELAGLSAESVEGQRVSRAADRLEDLRIHGAILADETGFGKTKQCLLAALLYAVIAIEPECRPTLLLVPPGLISQWLDEIKEFWPFFTQVLSHGDPDLKRKMTMRTLTPRALSEMGNAVPHDLRFIFDKDNDQARRAIVISSYETHSIRTGYVIEEEVDGVHHDPPRYLSDGTPEWKEQPHTLLTRCTDHADVFGLLIADEAHKVKNKATGIWELLSMQDFSAILLSTATPMFNSVEDLIGLIELLGKRALMDVAYYSQIDLQKRSEIDNLKHVFLNEPLRVSELMQPLAPFGTTRLSLLHPPALRRILAAKGDTHREVAVYFRAVLDMVAVQRSQASQLPMTYDDNDKRRLLLQDLCHKVIYKTATVAHTSEEKAEYQRWHKKAAESAYLRSPF
ncbi:SNF2-like protein [Penicillium hispanicum]|uniref:SNF2-like protein n=1 Tax=Penicillium hispanicum TaxID=1080232 RepID=UPI002541978C|nr:SNF2-like protein [Penicillium hispanicum]KAJ5574154.1 SNF2-like protein [Penicillium hispanicum]